MPPFLDHGISQHVNPDNGIDQCGISGEFRVHRELEDFLWMMLGFEKDKGCGSLIATQRTNNKGYIAVCERAAHWNRARPV